MSALRTDGLTCGWGAVPAVEDLSLTADAGEIVMLLGANGAGKTTTLLTLAGALSPLAGTVMIAGQATTSPMHARARAGMALVPEGRSVVSSLSVRDNLRLGRGTVEDAVAVFGELKPLLDRRAGTLSGGEQQMLALARALASQPRILLCDELSLGLAPLVVRRLLDAVRGAADAGAAVIIVEQHVRLALDVADRGYVLARGRSVMDGPAADLRQRLGDIERAYLSGAVPDAPSSNGRGSSAVLERT